MLRTLLEEFSPRLFSTIFLYDFSPRSLPNVANRPRVIKSFARVIESGKVISLPMAREEPSFTVFVSFEHIVTQLRVPLPENIQPERSI